MSAEVKKPSKSKKKIPTLESILNSADHAYTDLTKRYYVLGRAYVEAIDYYGAEGRRAFKTRFPLTDNALRNLELVGRGRLLPQFAMCSNRFTCGLVNMDNSMSWQCKLIGVSKNGVVRVKINDKIVDKKFTDFMKKDVDAVLSIISSADKDLPIEELQKKVLNLRGEVRKKFKKNERDPYEITTQEGKKPFVKFYKAVPYTADDLLMLLEELERADASNASNASNASSK